MSDNPIPPPRYTPEQALAVAIALTTRALAEVRALKAAGTPFPAVNPWADRVHYEGSVVAHNGATWQATRDTGREPPHEDWALLAAPGAPGRGFNVRGTYAPGETYRALDVVALDGATFVALADDPGPCPGNGWQLISPRGRAGKQGDRGERGPQGPAGPPGPGAASMTLGEDGVLTLSLADGSSVSCDFYPLLAQLK